MKKKYFEKPIGAMSGYSLAKHRQYRFLCQRYGQGCIRDQSFRAGDAVGTPVCITTTVSFASLRIAKMMSQAAPTFLPKSSSISFVAHGDSVMRLPPRCQRTGVSLK